MLEARRTALGALSTRSERKREDIVQAAIEVFERDGFDRASMEEISRVAAVSKRTLYKYFPSKEEIFTEIFDRILHAVREATVLPYDSLEPLAKSLETLGRRMIESIRAPESMRMVRVAASRFLHSPEAAAGLRVAHERSKEGLVSWIRAAKRDGRLSVDKPKEAAMQFAGLIGEFAFWPQVLGSEPPLPPSRLKQVVRNAAAIFLSHYEITKPQTRSRTRAPTKRRTKR